MALTNPKYARPFVMGGFNPAGADVLAAGIAPRVPTAEKAGADVGDQSAGGDEDYVENPIGAVQAAFSGMVSPPEEPVPPIPAEQALPAPIGADQIQKAFAPLMAEIQGQKGPPGRAIPPPTPALATFLSVLAGGLGAQLAKDPRIEENIIQTLNQHEQRRQAIQDQNYAEELLFNRERATQRLAAVGQAVQAELEAAIKANDTDRMMKANKNLEMLRQLGEERGIRLTGIEARKTARVEGALKAEIGAKAAEALEPKDYAARRGELLTSKELPNVPQSKGLLGGLVGGIGEALFGKPAATRQSEIIQLDKEALHSGNEKTIAAAKRNIQQTVLRALGLQMKAEFNEKDSIAIRDKLRELYDLEPSEVDWVGE
jgi:hypothetical protein